MPYGRRGGEVVVNKQLVGSQISPAIAGFAAGGFIVVWSTTDTLQDGAGRAIKAQRYDSLGNAVGDEILINSSAAGDQREPSVTTLASGGYVVTWETTDTTQDGSGRAIKGQLFDASGAAIGAEFRINSQGTADQTVSSVTGLAGGGFVVTWQSADPAQDGHTSAIKGQIYNAAGAAVGGEFLVNTGAVGAESSPNVTSLAGGGFVATWTLGSGTNADIYAQVFDSNGAKIGNQFRANSTTAFNQDYASVSEISGGRFVVTWQSASSLTTGDGEIRARIFSADGTPLGNDFAVSTSRTNPDSGTPASTAWPSVEDLPNGGFVITWTFAFGSYPRSSILGQFFDSSGNRVGSEVLVSTVTNRGERESDLAVDGNGMLFAVWSSTNASGVDDDIRGQLFSPDGAPEIVSSGGGDSASVTVLENQTAVTTLSAMDPQGSTGLVYSIVGGLDASRFALNASTGVLTFVSAPNFESRLDFANNNVYDVIVSVSDGVHTDLQALAVTVANVNEAPVISTSETSYFHRENGTAVATFSASDPDGTAVTWSIAGGADAARFAIDAVTGALRFVTAPNFEAPEDVGADNFYNVVIAASDGSLSATRALTIEIANLNEGPVIVSGGGGNSAAVSVPENTGFITTIVADDPDFSNSSFSFSLAGGADAALFTINAQTGQLFFKSGRNFEAPTDADGNNVYEVIVSVSDGWEPADTQAISVTVTDANDAPVITSNGGGFLASLSLPENQLAVTTVTAADPDNGVLTYGLAGGADAALFAINAQTGLLSFIAAPDREAPTDSGANNVYNVTVSVSDGDKSDTQQLSITILDSNEAPVIASNGGGAAAAVSVAENGLAVTNVAAADPEGKVLSYAIAGGADSALFTIDSATGALSFAAAPDYEQPADSGGDNVYDVIVSASDGLLLDTQALSITVGNANEGISITSNGGGASAAISIGEGESEVATVAASDPDGTAPVYSIAGGADAARFAIDAATGALSFVAAPDFEAPADADGDNVYEVSVRAGDGELEDLQSISVTVGNRNDAPIIVSNGGGDTATASVTENSIFVTTVAATEADGVSVGYSIVGGADASRFAIDLGTGELTFLAAPDFEAPGDLDGDNVYEVTVSASDGYSQDVQTLLVAVGNGNDRPRIISNGGGSSSLPFEVDEGQRAVTIVAATDDDGTPGPVTYAITGGSDADLFVIDAATGELSFVDLPDYEAPFGGDNYYSVEVTASDGELGTSQLVQFVIRNVNEGVTVTSAGTASIEENGTSVTVVTAADADGDSVTFSLSGGADSALFRIDSATGALSFIAAPDFEAPADAGGDNVYDVEVSASDGSFTDTRALAVGVGNVNEGVTIRSGDGATSFAVTVGENDAAVTTVIAVDADRDPVVYSIAGGADALRFTIDAQSGALSFLQATNFEAPGDADGDNLYDVVVSATDGTFTDSQAIVVTVGDLDEPVSITSGGGGASASVAVSENATAATVVAAGDPDGGPVTYAIAGGADAARFTIDAATGALAFVAAPDFEAPADAGANNVYDVVVSASDGTFTDTQALAITVGNVNEGVAITSNGGGAGAAISVAENSRWVAMIVGADPDGPIPTYSIVGGADAARFTIDPVTGALQFVAAPDHELPEDADGDNVYAVTVRASDGQFVDDQALSVTVANQRDGNNVTGTSGSDSISASSTNLALRTSNAEDTVFGRDGHDTIQGMGGDDDLYGEGGNDTLIGGAGADRLTGGLGKDTFTYNMVSESTGSGRDLIMDFSRAQGDKISLSAIDANSVQSLNQAFTFIGSAAFSNVAGQLRYETAGGVTTVSGDVNGDGIADLQIQLSGTIALLASDFIL